MVPLKFFNSKKIKEKRFTWIGFGITLKQVSGI